MDKHRDHTPSHFHDCETPEIKSAKHMQQPQLKTSNEMSASLNQDDDNIQLPIKRTMSSFPSLFDRPPALPLPIDYNDNDNSHITALVFSSSTSKLLNQKGKKTNNLDVAATFSSLKPEDQGSQVDALNSTRLRKSNRRGEFETPDSSDSEHSQGLEIPLRPRPKGNWRKHWSKGTGSVRGSGKSSKDEDDSLAKK